MEHSWHPGEHLLRNSSNSYRSYGSDTDLPTASPVVLCNYLDKQNPNGVLSLKQWKKRWFMLDRATLTYSKSESGDPIKMISLLNIKNAVYTRDGQFEVLTNLFMDNRKPRTFYLKADSSEMAQAWVHSINVNTTLFKHASDPTPTRDQVLRDQDRVVTRL
eukprot:CAMPEP_0113698806 /NCGR_PEP_ID=MMETSP0038_2-20120614/22927_1 /TAXON_ID=2898 /ORGANISM="Cryptomonas paramecium" /LENGTH=160 /DNA_ID=CAMNT_0000622035 /DNA_START=168 /DNA_END=646 /DNA_ORIENTATION=+ /assembly_acc=CAM_ASM_000170